MSYRIFFFTYLSCVTAYILSAYQALNYTQIYSLFGNTQLYSSSHNTSHTIIYPASYQDFQYHLLHRLRYKLSDFSINLNSIHKKDYYGFLPIFKGALKKEGDFVLFSNTCFEYVKISMQTRTMWSFVLRIETYNPHSVLCSDNYLIAILNSYEVLNTFFSGEHIVEFESLTPGDSVDIDMNGVRIFTFKDSFAELIVNVINTAKLFLGEFLLGPDTPFIGNKAPEYVHQANREFLEDFMHLSFKKRNNSKLANPEKLLKSGDMIGILYFNGVSTMVMYSTGSRISHVGLVLEMDHEFYIIESQSTPHMKKKGIQKNLLRDWLLMAEEVGYGVIVIPLKEEIRQRLDTKALYEEFKRLEGFGYGYHNFLFGWLDTVRDNYPPEVSGEFVEIAFRILEQVMPKEVEIIIGEALNKRLQTVGLSFDKLALEAAKMNRTLMEVYTFPEQDSWIYSDGPSMVCSPLVAHLYRAGGIFGNIPFQATELTPRDLYSLDIFDTFPNLPSECIRNDPNLSYCQLLGDYQIELDSEYGTRKLFPNMFQNCGSKPPLYLRDSRC